MSHAKPQLFQSKKHFEVLDGLRGVAALAIVIFHFMEWIIPEPSLNFIGHGFLAVDFFFCLSGFVVGYAYDDRIKSMGLKEFFKLRLIRLHPMVVFGSVLGLLAFLFDPFGGESELYSAGRIILIFICSALLIPFPTMEERAFNNFGLNAPSWSLFWEYIANMVYALFLCRVNRKVLAALALIAAVVLYSVSYNTGNLLGGWNGDTFWHGGARIFYSFSAGLLIYRLNWIIKNQLGFIGLAVLLSFAFLAPYPSWNWLLEFLIVIFYFPLLVSLGAGTVLNSSVKKLCLFFGDMSYPLYMTHYAGIWIFGNYYMSRQPSATELTWIIIGGTLFMLAFAYLVMSFVDKPLRRYLTRLKIKQKA